MRQEILRVWNSKAEWCFPENYAADPEHCEFSGHCRICFTDRILALFAQKVREMEVENMHIEASSDKWQGFLDGVSTLRQALLKELEATP